MSSKIKQRISKLVVFFFACFFISFQVFECDETMTAASLAVKR
jgi:hypothetical protein